MASLVRFTALSGARTPVGHVDPYRRKGYTEDEGIKQESMDSKGVDSSVNAAPCYLLEMDEAKILLDCGWSDTFDPEELKNLKRVAKQIDAVLLTHGDVQHAGALPYAYAYLGLNCPVYCTIPVHNMGSTAMVEAFHGRNAFEDFQVFSLEDIDHAFDKAIQLRYLQPVALSGKAAGIVITAHAAGHSVGGTVWKIKKDTEDIVYAVDYNHKKERHLNGTILHLEKEALSRPSILITDSYNYLTALSDRKQTDKLLFDTIHRSLTITQSTIIIPVEASTRVLELAYLLDRYWTDGGLSFPLYFLAHQSSRTFNYAKSMLEWMSDKMNVVFSQNNPFDFTQKPEEIQRLPQGGKLILASSPNLEGGYSMELLRQFANDPNALVILPEKGSYDSLMRYLYDHWDSKAQVNADGLKEQIVLDVNIPIMIKQKVPLAGDELKEYRRQEQLKKEQEEEEKAKAKAMEEDDSDSEMDPAEGMNETFLPKETAVSGGFHGLHHAQYDIFCKDQVRSGGFFKQSHAYNMFPVFETRTRSDDYGEPIDPTLFMKGEYQYALAQQAANEALAMEEREKQKMKPAEEVIPTKCFVSRSMLSLQCRLMYLDLEGRIDKKSYEIILPKVSPKKMIVIHGSQESTDALVDYCTQAMSGDIFSPSVGECINVSSATNIYQVKLTDSLLSSLQFSRAGVYDVSFLSGVIEKPTEPMEEVAPDQDVVEMEPEAVKEEDVLASSALIPYLDSIPKAQMQVHKPVIIGNPKLSEFRKILQDAGFDTQFAAGTLVVNGSVVVRKAATGGVHSLVVDGVVGDVYFKVRKLLYSQVIVL